MSKQLILVEYKGKGDIQVRHYSNCASIKEAASKGLVTRHNEVHKFNSKEEAISFKQERFDEQDCSSIVTL